MENYWRALARSHSSIWARIARNARVVIPESPEIRSAYHFDNLARTRVTRNANGGTRFSEYCGKWHRDGGKIGDLVRYITTWMCANVGVCLAVGCEWDCGLLRVNPNGKEEFKRKGFKKDDAGAKCGIR